MTARWELCRDAVSAVVVALTPETDANYLYHDALSDAVLEGASSRRAFWHDPPRWTWMQSQDSTTATLRYEWNLNVILSRGVADIPAFVRSTATESLNIARAILLMSPTLGAQQVLVRGATPTSLGDADEVQMQIALVCEIDEVL